MRGAMPPPSHMSSRYGT